MTLKFWRWSLATQILTGLVLGIVLGLVAKTWWPESPALASAVKHVIHPIGSLFLKIIFMVVIPLLLSAIVLGIAGMGDLRKLGRVGIKSLVVTFILTAIGVGIALTLVNVLQPGHRISAEKRDALKQQYAGDVVTKVEQGTQERPLSEVLLNLIPSNPLAEAVHAFSPGYTGGGLLAVMVFAVFVGVAIAVTDPEKTGILTSFLEGVFAVTMTIIGFAMRIAPYCVACLGFSLAATMGFGILGTLGFYLATVLLGLGLHLFGTYSLAVRFFGSGRPMAFFRGAREALVTAFSTSSSNATLPVALRVAEKNLGLPPQISRFVITVGASANQNGTALYEGITVLFLAQVFGIDLTFTQQITVALMCILAGVGTAGVPGGSLPLVVGLLVSVGVPADSIAIILGIDRLLDMCRTTLNVAGDLVIADVVAQGENETAIGAA